KTRAGATIGYGYDRLNRLTTKTPPSGPVVSYSYDQTSRLTGVSDTSAAITPVAGSAATYTTTSTYDALNHLTGTSWGPTTAAAAPAPASPVLFGHSYNAANQRSRQTVSD